ncbi:glycosyltransferase family 4 protein [Moheibacter sediminis]|uniref:Glycosyltransferase involved in cell wall bisynthesis n=1 Tax=Moheibacter sediminis TaxID=1434700 RepID=A0A1W2BAS7_9FLAO|nr:glycosyltransferase family 4 protein [Moheibacter sediminis]SMC69944.1 Glycosyltransferase involved in cell wall bisynthesis [Moheibacter sediminis]
MHILHLIKTSEGATWAIKLLQEMKNAYKEITFSVVIPSGGKHFEEYKNLCKNVYDFDFKLDTGIYKQGKILKDIVLKENPDIIHSWFTQTTLYSRLFLRNVDIPVIFQVAGPAHLENSIFKLGDIKSAQKNDYWIATSEYIYNKYLSSGVSKNKLFLNYAFIDAKALLHSKEHIEPRNIRKEFNIDENIKIIGTASYIYPPKFYEKTGIKGHEFLLEVFEKLLKKRNDVVLLIAGTTFGGDPSYENKLKQKAKNIAKDKVIFTGKYHHIYEIISNFDIFIYLSKSENLGGVYESLLFEIPTISSNKGALTELVINNETGFNADPNDTDKLVEHILSLLENDNKILKTKGKDLVMNKFNKEAIVQKTYEVYTKIIEDFKIKHFD